MSVIFVYELGEDQKTCLAITDLNYDDAMAAHISKQQRKYFKKRDQTYRNDLINEQFINITSDNQMCYKRQDEQTGKVIDYCKCASGYQRDSENNCVDIDECLNAVEYCGNKICTNLIGAYRCGKLFFWKIHTFYNFDLKMFILFRLRVWF